MKINKEQEKKMFDLYKHCTKKICANILITQIKKDDFSDFIAVQGLVSEMIKDFTVYFKNNSHQGMTDSEIENGGNIVRNSLLSIGGKFDFFTPTEKISIECILEVADLVLAIEELLESKD